MLIEIVLRKHYDVEVEGRARLEVPDDFLGDHDSYEEWFAENFEPGEQTLLGIPLEQQLEATEKEIDRDRPMHSGADWYLDYVHENITPPQPPAEPVIPPNLHVPQPVLEMLAAQSRMADWWAESDKQTRESLWAYLHYTADQLRQHYNLPHLGLHKPEFRY